MPRNTREIESSLRAKVVQTINNSLMNQHDRSIQECPKSCLDLVSLSKCECIQSIMVHVDVLCIDNFLLVSFLLIQLSDLKFPLVENQKRMKGHLLYEGAPYSFQFKRVVHRCEK
jgi:hypothetical protein